MKKALHLAFFFAFLLVFNSCKEKIVDIYTGHVPVYMTYEELDKSIKVTEIQNIEKPGKLYFKDNIIFMNDYLKGIHVLDNSNPANPQKLAFINIPGNADVAVVDQTLYADCYTYLLVFDISDINNITLTKKIEDVFPYTVPNYDKTYKAQRPDRDKGIVIGWELQDIKDEYTGSEAMETFNVYDSQHILGNEKPLTKSGSYGSTTLSDGYGVGGSMARILASNNTLYILNNGLHVYDITDRTSPSFVKSYDHSFDVVETLFQDGSNLFIGTQSGVLIYDVENPQDPVYISDFAHATGCDPVVASNGYAYVTLRSGNDCGEVEDQLDIIDINDIENPELVKTVEMDSPYGLGVLNEVLFVCDGDAGLKMFDVTDPVEPNLTNTYQSMSPYDIIPLNNDLILIVGENGLLQYSLDQSFQLHEVGSIPLE
jgi:hypothetical protein